MQYVKNKFYTLVLVLTFKPLDGLGPVYLSKILKAN